MSIRDLEVLGYDPKELEKLRDEFNVSDESIKFNAAMIHMCGTDPRINTVYQGTTGMKQTPEPRIKVQGTTSSPTSNPFSRREFVRRIKTHK